MTFFRPIPTQRIDAQTWPVQGTPADCAALAIHHFLRDCRPDLVVSGINHGLNVGWDVNYSGTVGAATEAALLGYKAIAVSVDLQRNLEVTTQHDVFDRAAALTGKVIVQLERISWPASEILNINHPGIEVRAVVQASCSYYNMHIPNITAVSDTVFTIGGSRQVNRGDRSQDGSATQEGNATLSFIQVRQSSTDSDPSLATILPDLG